MFPIRRVVRIIATKVIYDPLVQFRTMKRITRFYKERYILVFPVLTLVEWFLILINLNLFSFILFVIIHNLFTELNIKNHPTNVQ